MVKRVILIALLLALALLGYAGYHTYDAKRAEMNGAVYSNGVVRRAQPPTKDPSSDTEKVVYPPGMPTADTAVQQDQKPTQPDRASTQATTVPTEESEQGMQGQRAAPGAVPETDSISPNPPNGMTFAGSGRFQLYRQGNITWRLDTESGRTCIIFATDEEWRKPKVYKAGCGKS